MMVAVNMATRKKSYKSFVFGVLLLLLCAIFLVLDFFQPLFLPETGSTQDLPQSGEAQGDTSSGLAKMNTTQSQKWNTSKTSTRKKVAYPLGALKLESAQEAYEQGFWQRADPVPLDRWSATANTTCIPNKVPIPHWKKRLPHIIMIGTQKGGTTALSYYLYNHPSVQYFPSKELHYFDEDLDQDPTILANGTGIPATKALDQYQQNVIGGTVPLIKFELEYKYALDATPNYMWLSDRVPHRIFCITPWVKLLAVLRNPVDRAFSQYHMQFHRDLLNPETRRGFVSFEDYIALDMKVLQDTGVLPKGYGGWNEMGNSQDFPVPDPSFLQSEEAIKAWAIYTKLGLNSPVGRGLYAFQLRHWFQAMDLYNKPLSDLKVVSSERLLNFPNDTYAEILDFAALSPHSLAKYSKVHATQYRAQEMSPEIRAKLESFYAPFNRQLHDLLGSKEWVGIWEESHD